MDESLHYYIYWVIYGARLSVDVDAFDLTDDSILLFCSASTLSPTPPTPDDWIDRSQPGQTETF